MDQHHQDQDQDHGHHGPLAGDSEDPVAGPTWAIGLASVFVFVASMLLFAAIFFFFDSREQDRKTIDEVVNIAPIELEALRRAQQTRLEGPVRVERRIDGEESLVIPIEDAMTRMLEDTSRP